MSTTPINDHEPSAMLSNVEIEMVIKIWRQMIKTTNEKFEAGIRERAL
ncbi:MAG: hypothetical protein JO154_06685 [Chitinophaga sp.]|nr:hypothetical protein [Chitinophaga sp.]MBV8252278.1 hypothetical protein [Chitinophaga sp.]